MVPQTLIKRTEKLILDEGKESFSPLKKSILSYYKHSSPIYKKLFPPYLPVSLLKERTFPQKEKFHFHTSGTTTNVHGIHALPTLNLYRLGARKSFFSTFGHPTGFLFLSPPVSKKPHSSLIHMFSFLAFKKKSFYALQEKKWAIDDTFQFLSSFSEKDTLCIFSTFLGLISFFEALSPAIHLPFPKHAFLVLTGGTKGKKVSMTKKDCIELIRKSWGIKAIFEEYGMTEMSACFYGRNGLFQDLGFAKSAVLDPAKKQVTSKPGREGILCFADLSNLYTFPFLMSEDWGRKTSKGFRLLGRLPRAELRGCSLDYEHLFSLHA